MYRSIPQLMETYSLSEKTIRKRVKEMEKLVGERYEKNEVILIGNRYRVDENAFQDYIVNERLLKRGINVERG